MLVRMRLGVIADIRGNDVALRAVPKDGESLDVGTANWLFTPVVVRHVRRE
jgi:hypothetical protein